MAITRCPYCHAIVDETNKYCDNCGTQLLFPEDEELEEEIPGEKIIEDETEEKDYSIYEIEAPPEELSRVIEEVKGGEDEKSQSQGEEDLYELPISEESEAEQEEELEDVTVVDREEEIEERCFIEEPVEDRPAIEAIEEPERAEKFELKDEASEEKLIEKEETSELETGPQEEKYPEIQEKQPPSEPAKLDTFDTSELEKMGKTVDLGKVRLDKLLEDMREETKPEADTREPTGKPTDSLPPWVSSIRDKSLKEEEIFPKRKKLEKTVGLPEKDLTLSIPFKEEAEGEEAGEAEQEEEASEAESGERSQEVDAFQPERAWALRSDSDSKDEILERPVRSFDRIKLGWGKKIREEETEEEFKKIREEIEVEETEPFSFSVFIKSRVFDLLFVGIFWLVGLWLAAHSMGATLFDVFTITAGSALAFYAVLIVIYIFLFKFFLGETLGDRLFRMRE